MIGREVVHNMSNELGAAGPLCPVNPERGGAWACIWRRASLALSALVAQQPLSVYYWCAGDVELQGGGHRHRLELRLGH